jgi:hypothetical protein
MEVRTLKKVVKINDVNILEYLSLYIKNIKIGFVPKSLDINEEIIFKSMKDFERFLKRFFISKTSLSRNYWLSRGYDENEIDDLIENEKNIRISKGLSPDNREKYQMNIEYYLSRGYTEEDARIKIKERQTTFSKKNMY